MTDYFNYIEENTIKKNNKKYILVHSDKILNYINNAVNRQIKNIVIEHKLEEIDKQKKFYFVYLENNLVEINSNKYIHISSSEILQYINDNINSHLIYLANSKKN